MAPGSTPGSAWPRAAVAPDVLRAVHAGTQAIAACQAERDARLLQAALGTRHYGELLRGIDPARFALTSLPVSSKPQLPTTCSAARARPS